MRIQEIMNPDIECCTPEDTAKTAAEIMARRNCGFIPVVKDRESGTLIGVFTDRDLALYLGMSGRTAAKIKVKEFCSGEPKYLTVDEEIHKVKQLMEKFQIHRVPVVNREGKILGVISLTDLAQEAWNERAEINPHVAEREIAQIVESISIAR